VSPWSPRSIFRGNLRADLRPGTVTLGRKASFFSKQVQPLSSAEVDSHDLEPSVLPWSASVEALAGLLRETRSPGASVEVVVSNHFTRYVLVPWSENLVRDAERLAFARLAFRDVYGAVVDSWEVCLDDQPAGQSMFGSAIDRELLAALGAAVASAGLRLDSIVPALADCINRHRRVLKNQGFCLASAEAGRVTFAFHGHAGWSAVRSRRMEGPLSELLPTLLKQEASAAGVEEGGILYLCSPNVQDHSGMLVSGWQLTLLDEAESRSNAIAPPTLIGMMES